MMMIVVTFFKDLQVTVVVITIVTMLQKFFH